MLMVRNPRWCEAIAAQAYVEMLEAGFTRVGEFHFDNAESAGSFLETFIRQGDLVLIKASRGIGLDKIVTMLEADREPRTADRPRKERLCDTAPGPP